jgi:cyclophilin family peptidyl-prolyl cis-trans isomerase
MKRYGLVCVLFAITLCVAQDTQSLLHLISGLGQTLAAQSVAPKQAVVETTAGTFIIDLTPATAPNQSAHFMKVAAEGGYDGTIFHRMVARGMVQGGDPLSKDPAMRDAYGSGGLNAVTDDPPAPKMTGGSVAAVTVPGKPNSGGAQFFVVLADQSALDGRYAVFGQVSDGMDVLMKISNTPVDAAGLATERVEIRRVTIRDTPPEPFVTESIGQLAEYRAVLETSEGPIAIEFLTEKAPNTVRQFMRMAAAGVYDGMAFHRVAPGFVIQTGAEGTRAVAFSDKQRKLVGPMAPEFNDTMHVKGIVSMARGADPASATTSFFICTGPSPALDGQYTAFARVVDGMMAVEAIEKAPRKDETPINRIELKTIRIEKK